jgi:phthiocerol/phenolphthiocerol synthesis type-I polyketide synthase E
MRVISIGVPLIESQQIVAEPNLKAVIPPQTSDSMATPVADPIANELTRIWQQVLGVESVGLDDNFFDLGGESSIAVQMFAQVESVFNVKLPLATLYEASTISELAAILRSEVSDSRWSPLVAIQPSGSRPPFFCMHGAGGNVLNYRELSQHLGNDQPFYGLQCPGLDGSCAPLTKIEEMAEQYAKEIRRVQPRGPYFLGGYCMGGTVAYEVAQQLAASGERVALLALFDTMNWHKVPLNICTKGFRAVQQGIFHLSGFLSLDSSGRAKFLHEKIAVARGRMPVWRGAVLSWFGKKPSDANSNDLLLANIWKINDHACWDYVPKPYPGKVTDFRPMKQYWIFDKPDLKWDGLAQAGQETVILPVYPASMLVEPFVSTLATALRKQIDAAIEVKR